MSTHPTDRDENELGEMDGDESFSIPPTERKLITQPVDLSVQTLFEQWETKTLFLPDIQREYVWDNGKASRLIESLLLNIPIPVLYFAETHDATYEIIDGHQRVKSIVRFLANEFSLVGLHVLAEHRGLRFRQLPEREQRFMKMRTLRAIIVSIDSHPAMKFEIFERLNTGAISLNAQELRNSVYRGALNDLLRELAKGFTFRSLIGSKTPRRRMVDEELVLRFLALANALGTYRTPLKRFLNDYMESEQKINSNELGRLREVFERTVSAVSRLLGSSAFRITGSDGKPIEKSVNRALFDAQMLACSWISGGLEKPDVERVRREVGGLSNDLEFLDAVRRATGDRARTFRRVRDTVEALKRSGLDFNVPYDLTK